MHRLQTYMHELNEHPTHCKGSVVLAGEVREGLASILSCHCSTCGYTITLETAKKVRGPRGYSRWECNLAAVWGQMVTGGGHSHLAETMSVLGVPVMTKSSFIQSERGIGEWWQKELEASMAEAGREEKRLAEEREDFHEGVPAITVIVDGGWSKRSHKHSYNANSGVAIIVGKATGKLLYIGVRNKYCTACTQGIPKENHTCYRNWDASSSQMKTDIMVEGFYQCERVHGVRYLCFIGDGDSSVYPTLIQSVPGWGYAIKKLECANRACKCYRASLEKLAHEKPMYKGKGGLTLKMRRRLTSAARSAIRMRSKEPDANKALQLLERDLINGPLHCFGHHNNCSPDFCLAAKNRLQQEPQGTVDSYNVEDDDEDDSSLGQAILDQERLWRETLKDDTTTEEDTRRGGPTPTDVNPQLLHDIQTLVSILVSKSRQLLGNHTTNLAEGWMHIRCKFDGGKVVNRSQSGSWEHRCMGAGLQQNMGKTWGPAVWSKMTDSSPNQVFINATESIAKKAESDRKRKATETAKEARRKSKYAKMDNSEAARKAYSRHDDGAIPDEVTDDVPPDFLKELMMSYFNTKVRVTEADS